MPSNLKLEAFSDRDLLYAVQDAAKGDFVDSEYLAKALGVTSANAKQCVSMRLSFMARHMGVIERDPDEKHTARWRVSDRGLAFLKGKLPAREQDRLDKMSEGDVLMLTRYVTDRARRSGMDAQRMMNREWRYGTHRFRN